MDAGSPCDFVMLFLQNTRDVFYLIHLRLFISQHINILEV